MDDFIYISQQLGKNLLYVQGAGGNSSVKLGNKLYVKASGYKLKQVKNGQGYACLKHKPLVNFISNKNKYSTADEKEFLQLLNSQIIADKSHGKPSMEAGFHAVISSKYVLHLHSVYANVFNCMKYGSREIKKICNNMSYIIFDYKNPGYELAFALSKKPSLPPLIFLKNHGVIVHGQNIKSCKKIIDDLHWEIEKYLKSKNSFEHFRISSKFRKLHYYSFPDSAVFAKLDFYKLSDIKKKELLEISGAQEFITNSIKRLGMLPTYLTKKSVNKLLNMEQEKHRLEVFKK